MAMKRAPEPRPAAKNSGSSIEERVDAFLRSNPGVDFCDECLARELAVRRRLAGIAASWLALSQQFHRGPWICSRCGEARTVTRARAPIGAQKVTRTA